MGVAPKIHVVLVVAFCGAYIKAQSCNNCALCNPDNTCETCNVGYFGDDCTNPCPSGCANNVCDHEHGICTDCTNYPEGAGCCQDGFYGEKCQERCPANCTACYLTVSEDQVPLCTACEKGRFGPMCQPCPGHCASGQCDYNSADCIGECVDGFFGKACTEPCPPHCLYKNCTRENGICSDGCEGGYFMEKCDDKCPGKCIDLHCQQLNGPYCPDGCVDGYFNPVCSGLCPGHCLYDKCGQDDPKCVYGCQEGYFTEYCIPHCLEVGHCLNVNCHPDNGTCVDGCIEGYYGEYCRDNCSRNCKFGVCDQFGGECTYGCIDDIYNDATCRCPRNCECSPNGTCEQCKSDFLFKYKQCQCTKRECEDDECTLCLSPQFYTYNGACCQCSSHCKDGMCSSEFACKSGCEDDYFGEDCSLSCSATNTNCLTCELVEGTNSLSCVRCKDGFFSIADGSCSPCSQTCLNESCEPDAGHCKAGCVDGYWGEQCETKCEDGCIRCLWETGQCMSTGGDEPNQGNVSNQAATHNRMSMPTVTPLYLLLLFLSFIIADFRSSL